MRERGMGKNEIERNKKNEKYKNNRQKGRKDRQI